jgi:hypothetical protein
VHLHLLDSIILKASFFVTCSFEGLGVTVSALFSYSLGLFSFLKETDRERQTKFHTQLKRQYGNYNFVRFISHSFTYIFIFLKGYGKIKSSELNDERQIPYLI